MLDVAGNELKENFSRAAHQLGQPCVELHGICATHQQGLAWIREQNRQKQWQAKKKCVAWLGASMGNLTRREAAVFLKNLASTCLSSGDTVLIGIDRRNEQKAVEAAYGDGRGATRKLMMHGLVHASQILGPSGRLLASLSKFEYVHRYNVKQGRHEAYYRSIQPLQLCIPGPLGDDIAVKLSKGELIQVEYAHKYSRLEALDLFSYARLCVAGQWTDKAGMYDVWLLEKPKVFFESASILTGVRRDLVLNDTSSWPWQKSAPKGNWEMGSDGEGGPLRTPLILTKATANLPSRTDWHRLWLLWETLAQETMTHAEMHHKCLYYLGHIAAFIDISLSKHQGDGMLNAAMAAFFERPAPLVDSTTHSKVPIGDKSWPLLEAVTQYKDANKRRIFAMYDDQLNELDRWSRRRERLLWMLFEYQAQHLETLIHMLVQSAETILPDQCPNWQRLQQRWEDESREKESRETENDGPLLLKFKAANVTLGHRDDESADEAKVPLTQGGVATNFGWDNETPSRAVRTEAFAIDARPITNGELLAYLEAEQVLEAEFPAAWTKMSDDAMGVRTLYGPVPMDIARLWPATASAELFARYAAWRGGRLPTHAELRLCLDATSGPNSTDQPDSNVGFRNWHPIPPRLAACLPHGGGILPGHNGGVWEWTSTVFDSYPGFKASSLLPGYSADFFDGTHHVVLGGSWATIPQIASRRSFVNWYPSTYPCAFAGARVVYDRGTHKKLRTRAVTLGNGCYFYHTFAG